MKKINKGDIKLKVFQITLLIIFLLFLLFLFSPKNYTKKYTINKVEIVEEYNKKEKNYYFVLKYNNTTLDYLIESKYFKNRELIKKVEILTEENDFCLVPSGKKLKFIPLCYENNQIKSYDKVSGNLKDKISKYIKSENKKIESYHDIDIYSKDYTYFLWNYKGFEFINKDNKKTINIFNKELYNLNLVGYTKDYLVIADYDSEYTFKNLYTIDYKKGNLKKEEIDRKIYFDSYFIGYEKNNLYIVDNKERLMYEFDTKKGKISKIKSKVLENNNWKNVNINTLLNQKQEFKYSSNYEYLLENNEIYLKYRKKEYKKFITDGVTSIIRIKNGDIFYLKKDTLYHYNELVGEEKLLTYFEWNFNYNNMIYVN